MSRSRRPKGMRPAIDDGRAGADINQKTELNARRDEQRRPNASPERPRLPSLRKPPTLYRSILREAENNTISAQTAVRRARGVIHHDPAESFRSPFPEVAPEPRYEREHVFEYPVAPAPDEPPAPQAWFDDFHVPKTQEPFGAPQMLPPVVGLEEGDSTSPFEEAHAAIDEGPLRDPLGMLEVPNSIERVRNGDLLPTEHSGESQVQEPSYGLDTHIELPAALTFLQPGSAHVAYEPHDAMPDPVALMPPELHL